MRVICAGHNQGGFDVQQLSVAFDVTRQTMVEKLKRLKDLGLIRTEKQTRRRASRVVAVPTEYGVRCFQFMSLQHQVDKGPKDLSLGFKN